MRFALSRWNGPLLIMFVCVLVVSCGGGTDGNALPPSGPTVARIEVMPAAALLTGSGQTKSFTAKVFDANGDELHVPVRWESSNPTNVQISPDGSASTFSDLGSTQIFAVVNGVRSPPVLVLIAKPVEGAVLVADSQVVSGPELVRPGSEGTLVGGQIAFTLKDTPIPSVGTLMLASEATPLAGTVVATNPEGQTIRVILEVTPLSEWFQAFHLEESFALTSFEPALEDLPGALTVTRSSEETRILYEPLAGRTLAQSRFKCEGSIGDLLDVTTLKLEQSITGSVDVRHTAATTYEPMRLSMVLNGKLALKATGGIFAKIGLSGEGKCTLRIGSIPLRFLGAFSVAFSPAIALEGIVQANNASITAVTLEAGFEGEVGQQAALGFHYTGATASSSSSFTPVSSITPIYSITPKFKAPTKHDMRLDGKFTVGPQLSLLAQFGTIGIFSLYDISLLEAGAGFVGEVSFTHSVPQAQDKAYASKYGLNVETWFGLGDGIEKVLKALNADGNFGVEAKLDPIVLMKLINSPTGTLAADEAHVLSGDNVLFSVNLIDDVVPWFGDNIESVELHWAYDGKAPSYLATMDRIGSNAFMYNWTAPSFYDGNFHFTAFVRSFLAPSFPLEIAEDSTTTVNVAGVCKAPSNPSGPGNPSDPGNPGNPGGPSEPGDEGELWVGDIIMTTIYNGPEGNYDVSIYKEERWTNLRDRTPEEPTSAWFDATWSVTGTRSGSSLACSFQGEFSGTGPYDSLAFYEDPFDDLAYTIHTYSTGDGEPSANGIDFVTCDSTSNEIPTTTLASFLFPPVGIEGRASETDPNRIQGTSTYSNETTTITVTWNLTRPECAQ